MFLIILNFKRDCHFPALTFFFVALVLDVLDRPTMESRFCFLPLFFPKQKIFNNFPPPPPKKKKDFEINVIGAE